MKEKFLFDAKLVLADLILIRETDWESLGGRIKRHQCLLIAGLSFLFTALVHAMRHIAPLLAQLTGRASFPRLIGLYRLTWGTLLIGGVVTIALYLIMLRRGVDEVK